MRLAGYFEILTISLTCFLNRATVSRDGEVRVFDVRGPLGASPRGGHLEFSSRSTGVKIFRCHSRETKRICTEEASDTFMTVGGVCTYLFYISVH